MRSLRSCKGQSLAEYAILIALVIGAVFAMQNYIRTRLQGLMHGYTEEYVRQATPAGVAVDPFTPDRTVTSNSNIGMTMDSVRTGNIGISSTSNTTQTN